VELQEGSFFDSVPTGGDMYVLKMILHDWSDDTAVEILQSVRSAAEVGTRVLVIDRVIPDHDREFFSLWTDLEMLLLQAGREPTVPTASPISFLEGEAI
jgi:C-methyltransferase